MTHSTTLRCPDLYIIFPIDSSGVGFTGGKVSSKTVAKVLACIPLVSRRLSVLGEIDIAMLEEGWHPRCLSEGKLWGFTLIHQVIALIQPKFFV